MHVKKKSNFRFFFLDPSLDMPEEQRKFISPF